MKLPAAITFLVLTFIFTACSSEGINLYDLKCENLLNPLGIDNTTPPRLSWKIKSAFNNTSQSAFQLLAATDPSLLQEDKANLWNSGKTVSGESVLVKYGGKPLEEGRTVYWKVRIWDQDGKVTSWSPVAMFSVGLSGNTGWKASYIGYLTENGYKECPQLKKTFEISKKSGRYYLYVNSLGYHEVYLNGQKVGDGVLAPAVSQFTKRSWVITYNVSSLIKKGKNDLVLWLGSGWYTDGLPGVVSNGPLVKAQLEVETRDSRNLVLVTDSTWKGRKTGYTRNGDWRPHRFGGEVVDASNVENGLSVNDNHAQSWKPVKVFHVPAQEVSPQMVELNKIHESLKPASINQLNDTSYLVDMGKSVTGWTEIQFPRLKRSQKITIEYSDHLKQDGTFADQKQADEYIASGSENEIFKNKFNYHGYRYIRISNLPEAPKAESVRSYLIHTGYELASGFECSDADLNKIHDMIFYTLRCLSIGGDLVDCPQIERLGYGGDGNASTETAQTMFNLNPLYMNWLQAWADCIREDGGMPHTAPNPYKAGGGPYWCGFIITASWRTYQNYGDASVLRKYYPEMQQWLGYVDKYSVDGLLKKWPDNDYRNWYLGDWATPKGIDQTAPASVDLVNNCFVAVCYDNMQEIARVLGKTDDIEKYAAKKEQLQKKIHQTFFNESLKSYGTGTQIDLAYPMLAGVVPQEYASQVMESLFSETQKREGHLSTGLVGVPVLTEWAVKNNAADWMYSMLKKRDYPGYLYMVDNGATTTWEHWNGDRSRIHNCYNGVGSWFYQAVGGIRHNGPGYRKVIIGPQVPKGVTWAKTHKETPYGDIAVDWEIKGSEMHLNVAVPVGISANVAIPAGVKAYTVDGKEFPAQGIGQSYADLGSGRYNIRYSVK